MKTLDSTTFRLALRPGLSLAEKSVMFGLMTQHFSGVTPEQFSRDLAEKNLAVLLERNDQLVGFTTLLAYTTVFEEKPVNVIYSGDTIVAPEAWGSAALPRGWVAGVETLRAQLPEAPCFWLLLTSGFRTYRFLSVFWREFFPRCDAVTPASSQRLLNFLAQERFGAEFDPASGIVRFASPQRLRSHLSEIPPGREHDLHTAFFLSRNPGYRNGDELVCLTEISRQNLTRAGSRMMTLETYAS